MLLHELFYAGKFSLAKAIIGRQGDRFKPELGLQILTSHMDMRRLVAFAAVKMKPIWADSQNRWHGSILACRVVVGNEEQDLQSNGPAKQNSPTRGIPLRCLRDLL